ncbi:peptidase C14 [Nostoc linckia z18]|uniref:Peptidase C14 n=2 Tax=Nostoc linckia TaxID=92942 RepID=A0A9Q5ZEY6_NOSLI|nr:caspase family protein [Nostoc linckia]PHK36630.1 peptidase C14 [Nostoc linckia z15]PHK47194.1 peptidase C14 [Nostoc linckia z16]PHJ63895.1 peptidase C14 [Nostoc linckia z1]PHJ69465.1 peptidase C14 [Nostoc linckia z3]PHJ74748.1 peptidase C14 [Nostoc linckia z2]
MTFNRRQFLQFTASSVAGFGLSQFFTQADRFGKVLAKTTPRKLAFLVGINKYPGEGALRGCVNDVETMRHLLIYRFGFQPTDILTLTDKKATRTGILQGFEEHLIKQAKSDDVVVFHYSGHGSQVYDPNPITEELGLNGTFVPVDSGLPAGYPEKSGTVEDIMGHTLFLLMSACQSENFTAVLDSCFSGGAMRNYKVRSRPGGKSALISANEKDYQRKWLSKLNLSPSEFIRRYRAGVAKGVILAATNPEQTAADARFNGFYAGAFSYPLTRYLWQNSSTPEKAIAQVLEYLHQEDYEQTPILEVKPQSRNEKQPIFFVDAANTTADAVITEITGNRAKLWLGGVDVGNIEEGSQFRAMGVNKANSAEVQLISRTGLVGIATVKGLVKPGMLLQAMA